MQIRKRKEREEEQEMTIGQSMMIARRNKKLTQAELAERIGTTQISISNYETNKTLPSLLMAICIADELGITLDELVGRSKE